MSDPAAVEFEHVFKAFGNRKILDDVSFKVNVGEALCILGRSGTGKSVTLKLMIGLLKPDSGRVCVDSADIPHSNEEELSRVRRHMGFLFQSAALFVSFTLGDNLALPLRRLDKSKSPSAIERAVDEALERVGLDLDKAKMPSELSGGMRKRAGLANGYRSEERRGKRSTGCRQSESGSGSSQAGKSDFQSRDLFTKAEDTLNNAKDVSWQLAQTSQQVRLTLTDALGPDRSGENAADNIRETFSNINLATANMADDTEALKHEFFSRGFFKKRGFYNLIDLTPDQYRSNPYFNSQKNQRAWLNAADSFGKDSNGTEVLSAVGEQQIDQVIGAAKDSVMDQPIIIEGYSNHASAADELATSRSRSLLIAHYLEKRFHLSARNIGVMPLSGTAPSSSGKDSWDGACIVLLPGIKGTN
jgi:predicted ABC-type transport system involved in lysophospholipase L1 biosynthesis ATPase subunit